MDAGIIVTEQITDEYLWFIAMEEIRLTFEDREYFKQVLLQEGEEFSKFGEEEMNMLELTEPLNFADNGRDFAWRWKSVFGCLSGRQKLEGVRKGEVSLIQALIEEKKDVLKKVEEGVTVQWP